MPFSRDADFSGLALSPEAVAQIQTALANSAAAAAAAASTASAAAAGVASSASTAAAGAVASAAATALEAAEDIMATAAAAAGTAAAAAASTSSPAPTRIPGLAARVRGLISADLGYAPEALLPSRVAQMAANLLPGSTVVLASGVCSLRGQMLADQGPLAAALVHHRCRPQHGAARAAI